MYNDYSIEYNDHSIQYSDHSYSKGYNDQIHCKE